MSRRAVGCDYAFEIVGKCTIVCCSACLHGCLLVGFSPRTCVCIVVRVSMRTSACLSVGRVTCVVTCMLVYLSLRRDVDYR